MRKVLHLWLLATIMPALTLSGSALSAENEAAAISDAEIPNFTGFWMRDGFIMEFFPASTGPSPLTNISGFRLQGIANYDSPILKPWAAEVVRQHGEIVRSGQLAPDAFTSCFPVGVPYSVLLRGNVQLLQAHDRVTIIHENDQHWRTVYLNREHSENIEPQYNGESIGWYEGDILVVDTVGIQRTQFSSIDRYGTPHTDAMHVIERYRIVTINGGPALRVDVRVEDPETFNMPWEGHMIYYHSHDTWWEEYVCEENNRAGVWMPTENDYVPPL